MENLKTKDQILSVAKAMNLYPIGGALGEIKGCGAYAESEMVTENGWETKYFGIATPFKGKTDNDIIDRVTITKKAFWEIINLWPLRMGKIIHSLWVIYICEGGLKSRCYRDHEFCPACREIIRAGRKIVKSEEERDLINCGAMILQLSSSYRVRGQDMAGEIDKINLKTAFLKELWRIRKLMLGREKAEKKKMGLLLNLFILAAIFKRKMVYDFLMELDIDKVKLDKMDWYYCLRRPSYNFRGKTIEERLAEVREVDKEQNNLILGI